MNVKIKLVIRDTTIPLHKHKDLMIDEKKNFFQKLKTTLHHTYIQIFHVLYKIMSVRYITLVYYLLPHRLASS